MSDILVHIQTLEGQPTDLSLQAVVKARAIAGSASVHALVAGGPGIRSIAPALAAAGADKVLVAESEALAAYVTAPHARALETALKAGAYGLVMLPATTVGNDVAPIVAARLDAACVLDADDVKAEGGSWIARRTEFDRKVSTWIGADGARALLVSVKDGIADVAAAKSAAGAVADLAVALTDADKRATVIRRDVAKKSVNLKGASVIVAAGAGVGTRENFSKIQDLANALKAQIGATRAVVDAGWLPADHQIGQTGATVRPDLYIACGISGAVQHWVGMMDSKTIVAINSDKNAPLMKRAHYRIAGDLNVVIPKLLKLMA